MSKNSPRPSVQENAMLGMAAPRHSVRSQSSNCSADVCKSLSLLSQPAALPEQSSVARCRGDGFVFRQDSLPKILWDVLLLLVVVVIALTLPMEMAIHEWSEEGVLGSNLENFIMCLFYADIFVNFNSAVPCVDAFGCECENTNRCVIARRYLKFWFWVDAVASFPADMIFNSNVDTSSTKLLRITRLGRLAKCAKIMATLPQVDIYLDFVHDKTGVDLSNMHSYCLKACSLLVCTVVLQAHYSACFLLAYADSWSSNFNVASNLPPFERFMIAWEWTFNLVLAGNKDGATILINPGTTASLIPLFLLAVHLLDIVMLLIWAGALSGYVSRDLGTDASRMALAQFLRQNRLPHRLRRKVDAYMRKSATRPWGKNVEPLFGNLSDSVRKEIQTGLFSGFVNHFLLFKQEPLSDEAFRVDVASRVQVQFRAPDEKVVSCGMPAEGLFCLHAGALQVTDISEGSPGNHEFQVGSYFGMEALLSPYHCSVSPFTVSTTEFSELLILTSEEFTRACDSRKDISEFVNFVRSSEGWIITDHITDHSSSCGVLERLYESWQLLKHQSCPTVSSEDLGVPLEYLLDQDCFLNDATTMLEQDSAELGTFRELREICWGDNARKQGFCESQKIPCPRDGRLGCAIIDTLHHRFPKRGFRARSTHYMSWCWDYSFNDVISGLTSWQELSKAVMARTFIWICFFCNNQRKILIDCQTGQTKANLESCFHHRLRSVKDSGGVIVLLDDYLKPRYTKRLWCIYEVFQAHQLKINISVALPASCQPRLAKDLMAGQISKISHSLLAIDSQQAKASHADDETNIKGLINLNMGFKCVNDDVKHFLTEWLGKVFQKTVLHKGITLTAQHVFPILDTSGQGVLDQDEIDMGEKKHPWISELFKSDGQQDGGDTWRASECPHGEANSQMPVDQQAITVGHPKPRKAWVAMHENMKSDASEDKGFTIWDFDLCIQSVHGGNVDEFFFKMLRCNAIKAPDEQDGTLNRIHHELLAKCQEEVTIMQDHLQHRQESIRQLNIEKRRSI